MTLFVDADGCPVAGICLKAAKEPSIDCVIVCDTGHEFAKPGARTITVKCESTGKSDL